MATARAAAASAKQVTRQNFAEAVRELEAHLKACDYVAMTALKTGAPTGWRRALPVDTPETAYLKAKLTAESFQPLHIAVCPFRLHATSPSTTLVAYPYNFHLFPRDELQLGISLLERASPLHDELLTTKLTMQYRMHDSIANWASNEMYGGLLKSSPSIASRLLVDYPFIKTTWITRSALLLLDTRMPYGSLNIDCEEHLDPAGTGSFYNNGEADVVAQHVLNLVQCGVCPTAIAVQSPYIAQVQLLRDRLEEYPEASGVEVSTIDSFQGREADAVVISMVRSNSLGAVGFLGDSRRMNVAITRARRHVALVCDSSTICNNAFLARLLRHIRQHGQVRHVEPGSFDGDSGLGFNPPALPSIS